MLKNLKKWKLGILAFMLVSGFAYGADLPLTSESSTPSFSHEDKWSMTVNLGELAAFGAGSAILGVGYLPLHFDANYVISPYWQWNFGFIFRYDWGSFIGPEFFALAGMRYSFSGTGLEGGFISLKGGPGYVYGRYNMGSRYSSRVYSSFEFGVQPEIGYSFKMGSNGYMTLGAGILFNFATPQGGGWSTLGKIVHQYIPILDVSIGVTF